MNAMVGGINREKKKKGKERVSERAREKEKGERAYAVFGTVCFVFLFHSWFLSFAILILSIRFFLNSYVSPSR